MPEVLRFFAGFGNVVESDVDLEFAPARFGDGEGLAGGGFYVCEELVL